MNESASQGIDIKVRGLHKSFKKGSGTIDVLSGIDFEVKAGDRIAIVGASGVGKSTLLHILGTLDRPSSGTVFFNDRNIFAQDERYLAELRNTTIGFAFQFHHLLPEFTALENVMIPAIIAGHQLVHARKSARSALEAVGLAPRLHHQPGELSGGEQQRVAIARAIVMGPQILLADEPTGNLDHKTGESIHRLLLELNETLGITLVVVTHNLELADLLPRQFRLSEGRLVQINQPRRPAEDG